MHDILTKRHHGTLADFATSSVLLGFDYDGTLAPITSAPADARMRRGTRRLLARVARRYPCVVISGRAQDDLVRRLGRLPLWQIFGNHGLEPWARTSGAEASVREWVDCLRSRLNGYGGVSVEDKVYSVTVHYRAARDKGRVRQAIARAVRGLPGARTLGGRLAINLIPRNGIDKGVALQRARGVLGCETAIYVGDDATDEDAFGSAPRSHLLAIRVGAANGSQARYCLRKQRDIDRLLQQLLELRNSRRRGASRDPFSRRVQA